MKRLVSESYRLLMMRVFDYFSCCFFTYYQCLSNLDYNASGRTRLVSSINLLSLPFMLSKRTASINNYLLPFLPFCALISTIFSKILKMILSRQMI